jgi:hypothetical protein
MNEAAKKLESLLAQGAAGVPRFPANSRYTSTATSTWLTPDGRMLPYLKRRFVPSPDHFATLSEHAVVEGDRIDSLAAGYLGDPELYWRICDANGAIRPGELTEVLGRRVRITLPAGVPGAANG